MSVTLTLINKIQLADDVWAFRFKPSEVQQWVAGQYMSIELPHNNPDSKGAKRWFTISSIPADRIMQITTRITNSSFKHALAAMPEGGHINLLGPPIGNFTWQDTDKPIVFVAGGIGITAFYSILRQRAHDGLPLQAHLIYANRTDDITFKKEFDDFAANNPEFKVDYVVGKPLTLRSLAELAPSITGSMVYIAGPTMMVKQLSDGLEASGLPYKQIKQDSFSSYNIQTY